MLDFCVYLLVIFYSSSTLISAFTPKAQHYNISKAQWEKEYSSGHWNYLDRVGTERVRNAIIVIMFYSVYGGGVWLLKAATQIIMQTEAEAP